MFRRFSVNFAILSIFLDIIIIIFSFAAAAYIRPFLNSLPFIRFIEPGFYIPIPMYFVLAFVWVGVFALFSVYDGRRNIKVIDELTNLTLGSVLAMIALAGLLYLTYRDVSRALFIGFVLMAFLLLVLWRLLARSLYLNKRRDATQSRRVLIIGAGKTGISLGNEIQQHPYLGLYLQGYLDDDSGKILENSSILGSVDMARDFSVEHRIHDVVIALPSRSYEKVNLLVSELHDIPVKVWIIPDYFNLALHKATVEEFAGIPMLDLRAPALSDPQRMIKRGFDLITCAVLFIPSVIVMGFISLAIKLEDNGTVLFRQVRVGENGRIFNMYKFRTMVPNAEQLRQIVEEVEGSRNIIHKRADDPRITKAGKFLRRSSLDEIPQIFNIIKGDMSLVGPRPELPYLVKLYKPSQRKRFAVPQGLTGWWQINGRSDKPMHLHTEDDIYYIQNYSLWFDIRILVKTVWVVLRGKGAY